MALSQDLVSQFAKMASPKENKNQGDTLKATYRKIGDIEYVQLDGSNILTPVESTVEVENGERVRVLIKDHFAIITDNITSPAARNKDVQTLKDEVDEFGNTIQQMDNTIIQQGNSIIQMNNTINQHSNTINQHDNLINEQGNRIISLNNTVISQGNAIELNNNSIIAQGNQIDSLNNTITEHGNNITSMNNTIQQHGNNITQMSNTIQQHGNTIVQQGNSIQQIDNTITEQGNTIIAQGNIIDAHGTQLTTHNSQITILNSGFAIIDGVLTGLSGAVIDNLKTNVLNTQYAKIDFANINIAAVEKLFTESGIIKDLVVDDGAITGELIGVTIKGDLIEGNTIVADKLVVLGSDGLYYKLNMDGQTTEAQQTEYNSLNGSIITAKSITASKISVEDLVAFDATIGGFDISDHSINTHNKAYLDSPAEGLYLGSDGQMALGNNVNHIKYYRDSTSGDYILDVRLNKLYLGTSQQTAEEQFNGMIEISANSLTNIFKSSGGSNLLRNSVGFSGTDFWTATGTITTYQQDEMSVSGSKFILTNNSTLEQVYSTQIGTSYSISFKFKHSTIGTAGTVKVELIGENGNNITVLNTTEEYNNWTSVALENPYVATTVSPRIKITCSDDDIFEITDLIISQGTSEVWSGYIDEVYGKEHKLDKNGLRLYSLSSNSSSNTTSTSYQLKEGNNIISELTKTHVLSQYGDFNNGENIGRLHTLVLDDNNIIEYV